jgi:acetyl-CoA carboxylase biotin carboxylase subunit
LSQLFSKVLIANRGEIAVRIIRSCRALGIKTVAVYSEADEQALHRMEADEAVLLGPPAPGQSYLNVDKLLAAAAETGAEAIHPGYGFLSENAAFANACQEAGLTWIGPNANVIEQLGDKLIARTLMEANGIPVTPGVVLEGDDPKAWEIQADTLGYPLLIKAAAGGGGKGMRIVRTKEEFATAYDMASSEARSAFGDDRVYLERYVENPRHIEFQILADTHGNTVHLFERECSIQRRHQKIIEETPSPVLDEAMRNTMGQAAIAAAKAADYTNAGTVEFLFDPGRNEFYFLEVNTRLQVEHPVTEMVTGLDLVQLQLQVAAGHTLPFTQDDLKSRGHSFECRIYAEDPAKNFIPSPGHIAYVKFPEGPGLRCDSGIYSNSDVPVHYDPILAKLVSYGPDRETARQRMVDALKRSVVLGVQTGIPFMIDVLEHEAFIKGDMSTHFIAEHLPNWSPSLDQQHLAGLAFVMDQLMPAAVQASGGGEGEASLPTPWQTLGNWRLGN